MGFVYNPGERVLGTTTPFYAMLLTPFALVGSDIILVGKIINILASTASVAMVFVVARHHFGDWVALLAAMLLAISTNNVWAASTGMETELNVLILLAVVYAYITGRYNAVAVLAAIAFITRPDDLILIAVMGGWHFFNVVRGKQSFPIRPLAIFILCLLPWLVFATVYFGSPIPNSVLGKAASYRVPALDNLVMYANQYGFTLASPKTWVVTILFLLGLVHSLRKQDNLIVLPIYFSIYSFVFVVLGARLGSGWYWQPLWPIHSILVAGGISYLGEIVRKSRAGLLVEKFKTPIVASLVIVFALIWGASLKSRFVDPRPADDLEWAELAQAGQWINQNTASNSTVALETIGAVGWFSDRFIIDEGGLVTPGAAKINERLGRPDSFTILRTFQPDYYLAWIHGELDAVESVPAQKEWLASHYQSIGSFDVGIGRAPYFLLFRKTTN